jgi:hypothetical protein
MTSLAPSAAGLADLIPAVTFVHAVYALLLLAGLVAGYGLACAIWPFTNCARCHGLGRHRSPGKKHWRDCRKCHGTGARVRLGRRLWTVGRRTYTDGTRRR